jgi:hypothetical protein
MMSARAQDGPKTKSATPNAIQANRVVGAAFAQRHNALRIGAIGLWIKIAEAKDLEFTAGPPAMPTQWRKKKGHFCEIIWVIIRKIVGRMTAQGLLFPQSDNLT